jgi:ethanolamine utilization protein EutA (predicted chaperonin)
MIFGVNTTKSAIIVAETKSARAKFVIIAIRRIPFQVRSGDDLAELQQTLLTLFQCKGKVARTVIALLKCSSGRFGSCLEAIKGEAMVELAASQRGRPVFKVAPQSLKKTLGCAKDQKWQDRAGELFNPNGKRPNWSNSAAGAVAAAFKVAGE